ncbi:hypothetical protein BH10PSE19_BH10PSE19_07660 [soil metagenome]
MNFLKNCNFDLGIKKLLPEWKKLFNGQFFLADLSAGIIVACVAIPLSLAIALASGVTPAVGLISAIIAGIVCALFGGTPLAVSGPAAAMTILIANTIETFGVKGLVLMCLISGAMQLISGVLGVGKFARYVPFPVIAGFTAGIGAIILIGQLPRAFGLEPPEQSHIFDVFTHLVHYIRNTNFFCLFLVAATFAIIRILPKYFPKIPSILVAVISVTVIAHFSEIQVPLIGEIPRSLPQPQLPEITSIDYLELFLSSFAIYILASLETLLSSSAVDKLAKGEKHNPNQELIGQGLGNIITSLFGGIPVTGVIARSAINVQAGAKTRRASIIHSLVILLTVFAIAPVISLIPIAALAGVLFSVAFNMINYREFRNLWFISRPEALVYGITFLTIVFFDLIAGVQVGIFAAGVIVLIKAARAHMHVSWLSDDQTIRLSLSGSLTFLTTTKLDDLEQQLQTTPANHTLILDLSNITNLDSSGALAIVDLFNQAQQKNIHFYLKGFPLRFEALLKINGGEILLEKYYIISERELRTKDNLHKLSTFHGRLVHGVQQFYKSKKHRNTRLFDYLALTQDPHTLFIACSDSRIIPNVMTSTDPGELFCIRNVGNFIPPFVDGGANSEAAAIEFALNKLAVTDIVICGHANCGAIKACCNPTPMSDSPELQNWIEKIKEQIQHSLSLPLNEIAQKNVVNQIENLKTYPAVKNKLRTKSINIYAWFFDFEKHVISEWNQKIAAFEPIAESSYKDIKKQPAINAIEGMS